ncbi:unnamed protein product [Urochloa humidicola]
MEKDGHLDYKGNGKAEKVDDKNKNKEAGRASGEPRSSYRKSLEDMMNEIAYEELCLVDGVLPPIKEWNGTTEGEIRISTDNQEDEEVTSKVRGKSRRPIR